MNDLSLLAQLAEIGSFAGMVFFMWLTWASGYAGMLWEAARVHRWGFGKSPLPPPSDSGFDWGKP